MGVGPQGDGRGVLLQVSPRGDLSGHRFCLHYVVQAERAGTMLEQPGVHALLVKLMKARNNTQVLSIGKLLQADDAHRAGVAAAGRVPLAP